MKKEKEKCDELIPELFPKNRFKATLTGALGPKIIASESMDGSLCLLSKPYSDLVIQQMCLHNGSGCTEESLTLCTCVQQRLEHSLRPIAAPVIDCICIGLFINGQPWPSNCQRTMIVQLGFIIARTNASFPSPLR